MKAFIRNSRMKHFDFCLLDLGCIFVSFHMAYLVHHGQICEMDSSYGMVLIFGGLVQILMFLLSSVYRNIVRRGFFQEFKAVFAANAVLVASMAMFLFFAKISQEISRVTILLFFPINVLVTYIIHLLWKKYLAYQNRNRKENEVLILITVKQDAEKKVQKLLKNQFGSLKLSGIILLDQTKEDPKKICGVPVVADKEQMYEYICSNRVNEVLIYGESEEVYEMANVLVDMGIVVHIGLTQPETSLLNFRVENVSGYTTITTSITSAPNWELAAKRALDIVGGLLGTLMTGILFLFVAPIIKIQAPGPVFFAQERVGKNGRIFKMYKFRSMYVDAEERKAELMKENQMQGLMFKIENDPRIYPFGHFLRKTSLDEFPQFFNVLKGDMSLVGTRPPTLDEYRQYELHHKSRLARPVGITGLWQTSGRPEEVILRILKKW
ncbi:MAG: sugar transferase [Marvinbryantia sp.]|jgi:exopolysaccharide biosynthesis polyprenyl glycosylphosphotransferase